MKKQFLFLLVAIMMSVSLSTFAQATQDFSLINKTGVTIHHVYITQHDSDTWGEDILGKDVFMDGDQTDVSFEPIEDVCLWDLKIDDADGNAITWQSIDLCKWVTVTLHWDGSKATATFE